MTKLIHENCPSCKVIANIVGKIAKDCSYSDGFHGAKVSLIRT